MENWSKKITEECSFIKMKPTKIYFLAEIALN